VLRGIHFTPILLRRFLDLQEKLHENACRRRIYVAIGTHDLSTITPPFYYRGEEQNKVIFVPLHITLTSPTVPLPSSDKITFSAPDLYNYYETNKLPLSKYTYLLKNAERIPVFRDSQNIILSVPPLVNGEHTKCTVTTKDVFVDITGTDVNKMSTVLNVLITSFAQYCDSVESVKVVSENNTIDLYPKLDPIEMDVNMDDVNELISSNITAEDAILLLEKKQIVASVVSSSSSSSSSSFSSSSSSTGIIHVKVPAHRADVLHWTDVAEDILIAEGVEKVKLINPTFSVTGSSLLAEDATELIRQVGANNGYVEMYNFVLISVEDGYERMYRPTCAGHCGKENKMRISSATSPYGSLPTASSNISSDSFCQCGIVRTLNGKLLDTESVRLSLLPGLFKSLKNNNAHPKPLSLFEVGDVVVPDYFGCGYSFISPNGKQNKCENVCGGGCCVSSVDLNTLYSASKDIALAPNPFLPPLFEYPNVMGILRSDSGCRNERHFAAVKCGPNVSPEQLIPLIARLLSNFHLQFNAEGEEGLKKSISTSSDKNVINNVINNIEGYWEMVHISSLKTNPEIEETSSYVRWVSDSSSFINNNFNLICLTYRNSIDNNYILYRIPIGIMGNIRPDVSKSFLINSILIAFELNLEPLYNRLL
jgi:phenylalanyl-tRNA synthetase beta subunit